MKVKHAVATLCIGEKASSFAKYTHGPMKDYASKIGADFIIFDEKRINFQDSRNFNPILFEKYQVHDLLTNYDRVLYLDTDILVTPHAPNVFDIVPADKVGGVFEDFGTEQDHRRELIRKVQKVLGDVNWKSGFMNSGMFVVSKMHQKIFRLYKIHGFYDGEYEQTNTNWYIRKAGFEIYALDFRFNFMGIMRLYHGPIHREAYFIHYAGKSGIFPWVPKIEQVKKDYEFFYKGIDTGSFEDF
ncbi:MAG: glycosyltransferase [Promethearchaeota archaeon]